MQPGSIVVVKPFKVQKIALPYVEWLPIQDENTPYMIREIFSEFGQEFVRFEEASIGRDTRGNELGLSINYVREILPPEDITEVIEDCICIPAPL